MDNYYDNGCIFDCGCMRIIIFLDFEQTRLKKSKLENNLEFYRLEFDKREKESAKIRNFIRSIESDDEEMAAQAAQQNTQKEG
ncbi:hypothetical protein [Helicobacter hepaticus]|uniref:hypothetical protein n=1 Tax=Helicobacter hepaticus TaxID=32025 RepID=UPI0039C7E954